MNIHVHQQTFMNIHVYQPTFVRTNYQEQSDLTQNLVAVSTQLVRTAHRLGGPHVKRAFDCEAWCLIGIRESAANPPPTRSH